MVALLVAPRPLDMSKRTFDSHLAASADEQALSRRVFLQCVIAGSLISCTNDGGPASGIDSKFKATAHTNIMWRYDGAGRFPDINPPQIWTTDTNIVWKTKVEIGGYSSPIVVRDRVFLTAEKGSLICLDLAGGRLLWQKDLFSKESRDIPADLSGKLMRGCGGDSKESTPTPTSNGQLVFYINAMGLCACYDLQGNRKWMRVIETAEDEENFSASPVFAGDRIVLSWGGLLALDAGTGRTIWNAKDAKTTYGTPNIAKIGGADVVITPGGNIVRLTDGEVLCADLFESTYATPIIEGNVLYVIGADSKAFELPAKVEKGMALREKWKTQLDGEFMASPLIRDGLIYTIDSQKCRLHLIEAKSGKVLTTTQSIDKNTRAAKLETGTKIEGLKTARFTYASPAASERHIFFFDDAGNAAIFEVGRQRPLIRSNKLNDALVGTPFFVDDRIILRGNKTVYCIRATS